MKKTILVSAVFAALSFSAVAADSHDRYVGSVDAFTGTIKNQSQFDDLIKYTDYKTQAKLKAAFKDGTLTAEEIKESGISDHHFYTGYLASAKNQTEYDKYLKQLNGGANMDDKFISNRDLKANNSMVMNQVDTKVQTVVNKQVKVDKEQNQQLEHLMEGQDVIGEYVQSIEKEVVNNTDRLDKVIDGLKELGNITQTPNLPDGGQQIPNPPAPPVEVNKPYDDTQVKNDIEINAGNIASNTDKINTNAGNIQTNTNNIASMGSAFEQRVDVVNGYLSQAGAAIASNSGRIDTLENNFNALANQTAAEIARMDGRIDELEKKTDKLKAGVAGANAIGSLTQYTGNGTHHVAVGIGGYDGANAIAGGYTYAISAQTTIRATVAYDSEGDFGFGASVGHSW